jgi:hypothetical protein
VAALCAVIGVIVQLYLIRNNARETSARQVYMSYSEATLKYPNCHSRTSTRSKPIRWNTFATRTTSAMLFAFDEILRVYDTPEWRNSFNEDLKYHMGYICESTTPEYDKMYFTKMRELLGDARKRCPTVEKK